MKCVGLTIIVQSLHPRLEATCLVELGVAEGLPAHDVPPHGQPGQCVAHGGPHQLNVFYDRIVQVSATVTVRTFTEEVRSDDVHLCSGPFLTETLSYSSLASQFADIK